MTLKERAEITMSPDWYELLREEFDKEYMLKLQDFLAREIRSYRVLPAVENIFNAFRYTPYANVKVLLLGQDPYPNPTHPHGLSFSVQEGVRPFPKSLQNIFQELQSDLHVPAPQTGCLVKWAEEGVMLLNSTLTVRQGAPMSHAGQGWEIFTDKVISLIDRRDTPTAFLLLGSHARSKKALIKNRRHAVFESTHPSPMSASYGFFGSRPFSKINGFLKDSGIKEIDFTL